MAKKQAFGEQAKQAKGAQRKLAKVVMATKGKRGKYAYKEVMVEQDSAMEFIKNNKS